MVNKTLSQGELRFFASLKHKQTKSRFLKLVRKMTKMKGLLAHLNMMVMTKTQGEKCKT
jgi:hypothetical protein